MLQERSDKYSKPCADIHQELEKMLPVNDRRLKAQQDTARILKDAPLRINCMLCEKDLEGADIFIHRDIPYAICGNCGHIQTTHQPPDGFPHQSAQALHFETIYSPVTQSEFISRALRIYQPKLDWLLDTVNQCGYGSDVKQSKWIDLGCGAGHFLWTLKQAGINQIEGFEDNASLRNTANQMLDGQFVRNVPEALHASVAETEAGIWTAFFLLEHLARPARLFEALSQKPSGTLFCFAVPVFGFATLLESAVESFFARQLDSGLHTQLYTAASIEFVMASYGFEPLGQWIFGQDGCDLARMLFLELQGKYPASLLNDVKKRLFDMADGLQHVIDKAHFAETRHVVAVKK
jgi:hypothetical protein